MPSHGVRSAVVSKGEPGGCKARCAVTIERMAAPVVISKGAKVTNEDGSLVFLTIEEADFHCGRDIYVVQVVAEQVGARYNVAPYTLVRMPEVGAMTTQDLPAAGGADSRIEAAL